MRRIWVTGPLATGSPGNLGPRFLGGGHPRPWRDWFAQWIDPHLAEIKGPKGVALFCPWGRPDAGAEPGTYDFTQQLDLNADPRCAAMRDEDLAVECDRYWAQGVAVMAYIGTPDGQEARAKDPVVFKAVLDGACRLGDVGIDASIAYPVGSLTWQAMEYIKAKGRTFYGEHAPYNIEGQDHWHEFPAVVRDNNDGTRALFRAEAIAAGFPNRRHIVIQERADTTAFLIEAKGWHPADEPIVKTYLTSPDELRAIMAEANDNAKKAAEWAAALEARDTLREQLAQLTTETEKATAEEDRLFSELTGLRTKVMQPLPS